MTDPSTGTGTGTGAAWLSSPTCWSTATEDPARRRDGTDVGDWRPAPGTEGRQCCTP